MRPTYKIITIIQAGLCMILTLILGIGLQEIGLVQDADRFCLACALYLAWLSRIRNP